MNKGIISPAETLSPDGLAVEQQLMAGVLSSPFPPSASAAANGASTGGSHCQLHSTKGAGKKGTAAQRAARHQAEQTRAAQAALRAFIQSIQVPDFHGAALLDLDQLEDLHRPHGTGDANDVCLEGDNSDAVSMESSGLEAQSESNTSSNSCSSTQQSQGLVSGVKDVRITPARGANAEISSPYSSGYNGDEEEEEEGDEEEGEELEGGGTAFELGLSPEQYLYAVAALCQVR